MRPAPIGGVPCVGIFLRDLAHTYASFGENSERPGRQARPEFDPSTSRLPAMSSVPLRHWWGQNIFRDFKEGGYTIQQCMYFLCMSNITPLKILLFK